MKVDTLIKNGYVIDTAQGVNEIKDIAIKNGRVVGCLGASGIEADETIDATGKLVIPGMIDAHAHFLPHGNVLAHCDAALSTIPVGITCAVDQGTAGVSNFRIYLEALRSSILKFKINLSFADVGMSGVGTIDGVYPTEIFDWRSWESRTELWIRAFQDYPNELLGMKLRIPAKALKVDGVQQGMEVLEHAVEMCNVLNKPLTVHICEAPGPMAQVATMLRAGDTMTHCFHGDEDNTILDENGRIRPEILEARERGVWFDTAEDVGNTSLVVAEKAIKQGFWPDAFSTDTTLYSIYRSNRVLLPHLMSKYYDWGMPLEEVVRRVTENPARHIGMLGEVGILCPGARGDVVIMEKRKQKTVFTDKFGNIARGSTLFVPLCTIVEGNVAFRSMDFLPEE